MTKVSSYQYGCVPLRRFWGGWGGSISLPFPASRGVHLFGSWSHFSISNPAIDVSSNVRFLTLFSLFDLMFMVTSPLTLTLLNPSFIFKDPCDYFGSTLIMQDNIPILSSADEWVSEVARLCLTLCDPHGLWSTRLLSSVHGILQARILEWVAISFSRGSSWPRDQTWVSLIAGRLFTLPVTREANRSADEQL